MFPTNYNLGNVKMNRSIDLTRSLLGVSPGAMNMCGNLGGTLSPLVIGFALERWGSWEAPLVSVAVLYVVVVLIVATSYQRRLILMTAGVCAAPARGSPCPRR